MTDTSYEVDLLLDAGYTMTEILGMAAIRRRAIANEIQQELDDINNSL